MPEEEQGTGLVAAHPGNTNAARHGLYSASGRVLQPRAQEITRSLMSHPHVKAEDSMAAEEIGALMAAVEALDEALSTARGQHRTSLWDIRLRATRQLRDWFKEFGATPRSHAEWAKDVATGGAMAEFARRRAERGGTDGRG